MFSNYIVGYKGDTFVIYLFVGFNNACDRCT